MARENNSELSIQAAIPGVEAPLELPELTEDTDVVPASSTAYTGFRYRDEQGEVFGEPWAGPDDCGLEIVFNGRSKDIFVEPETVVNYRNNFDNDEALQRLILDALNGKVGEEQ